MKTEQSVLVCRVCLDVGKDESSSSWLSLFTLYNDISISEHIQSLADVDIKEADGFPSWVCGTCMQDLQTGLNFKQKCEKSNSYLHSNALSFKKSIHQENVKKEDKVDYYDVNYFNEDEYSTNTCNPDTVFVEIDCKEQLSNKIKDCFEDEGHNKETATENMKINRVINDLPLKCQDCGGLFKSKCKLRVHRKKEHLVTEFVCPLCKRLFKSYKAFLLHKKKDIEHCKKAVQIHIEGVGKFRVFRCKFCEYSSNKIRYALQHNMTHSGERPHKCDLCSMSFGHISALQVHKEYHHEIHNNFILTCNFCGKVITGRRRYYQHLATHKPQTVQCDMCKKNFKSKSCLRTHMKRHALVKEFACELCAKTFFTMSDLRNHQNSIHLKKRYRCTICEYTNGSKDLINKHIKKHTGTNIVCMTCGKFVESLKFLEMHQQRHENKRFPCSVCDKLFYSRKSLSNHVRIKHNCSINPKAEHLESNLVT